MPSFFLEPDRAEPHIPASVLAVVAFGFSTSAFLVGIQPWSKTCAARFSDTLQYGQLLSIHCLGALYVNSNCNALLHLIAIYFFRPKGAWDIPAESITRCSIGACISHPIVFVQLFQATFPVTQVP